MHLHLWEQNPDIEIQRGFEIPENLDYIIFDKTGTITEGRPEVDDIIAYDTLNEELIKIAASVEQNSTHPIAKAILNKANELNIDLISTSKVENIPGMGFKAQLNSSEVLVGNFALMETFDVKVLNEALNHYHNLEKRSKTTIFIAQNKTILGILILSDKITWWEFERKWTFMIRKHEVTICLR